MTIASEDVELLINVLAKHPSVKNDGFRFAPIAEARFHQVNPGTLYWDWELPSGEKRGKTALAYYDLDGQIVSLVLLAVTDTVTDIELWRGDGQPVPHLPEQPDLWEMVPGRIYSPRT
jgi:hypothetical protein